MTHPLTQFEIQLKQRIAVYISSHELTTSEILLINKMVNNALKHNWGANYGFKELTESERALLEDVRDYVNNVGIEVEMYDGKGINKKIVRL